MLCPATLYLIGQRTYYRYPQVAIRFFACISGPNTLVLDDIFPSYALFAASSVSGTYGSESVWSGDAPTCPSATTASNYWQNNPDALFFDPLLPSNTITNLSQPSPHDLSICAGATPIAARENPTSYPVRGRHSVPKPIRGSGSKHTSASRTQSTATSSRHAPYPLSHDSATWGPLTVICQWTTGAVPCGETVVGTKRAVGQHLQAKHAIRLKPDTTICLWGGCQKSMRRESMARHILAVHIQDKVPCKGCGSCFARLDSLQRHQRTCLAKVWEENTFEACEI